MKIVSSKVPRFKFQSRFIDYFQIAYKKLRTRFLDTSHVIFEAKILVSANVATKIIGKIFNPWIGCLRVHIFVANVYEFYLIL